MSQRGSQARRLNEYFFFASFYNTTMDVIYLDNNATTRPAPEVVAAMQPYLERWYGNPSSVHRFGMKARQAIDEARAAVAELAGCKDSELIFTSGGTESINMALRGLLAARSPRRKIVTSAVEHSATRATCEFLAQGGTQIVEVGVDHDGGLDMPALEAALDDQTALVSIMWANNETGVVFPVDQIAALCRSRKIPFHCDATQALGKIPVRAAEVGIDAMSMAAHKFHGPKGVGALFVRRGLRIGSLLLGGPQERNRRGGTENVAGIVGTGQAAQLALAHLPDMSRVAQLRDRLESDILTRIAQTRVNGKTDQRVPNTTNIGFRSLEAEAILLLLSENDVCASAGAACSSGSLEPSHVIKAMKIDPLLAHGSVRFSLSRYTTTAEIDAALNILDAAIRRLRQVLPVAGGSATSAAPIVPGKTPVR